MESPRPVRPLEDLVDEVVADAEAGARHDRAAEAAAEETLQRAAALLVLRLLLGLLLILGLLVLRLLSVLGQLVLGQLALGGRGGLDVVVD